MFELVVMIFLVSHGVVDKEPLRAYKSRTQFSTEESCKDYQNTKDGKAIKAAFSDVAKKAKVKIKVSFTCGPFEDNTL